ncbi:MAG: cupredoxin domain-containing protein [Planctomycetota bacterium]|jgi:uncharacterized cupredoxin-like copper-binding protein
MNKTKTTATAIALLLSATSVFAGPGHDSGPAFGQPGSEAEVDRVIQISMDEMKFGPKQIPVKEGETIKFVVTNVGRAVHEFNLGTDVTWDGHRDEMRAMMKNGMMNMLRIDHDKMKEAGMMHDDPNSVLLEPGESGEVIWTFSDATEMGFACNVPGHREAGMVGGITFTPAEQKGSS